MTRISLPALALAGWIIFGVSCVLLPSVAQAAGCRLFDVSGEWSAVQQNGFTVRFKLTKQPRGVGTIRGTAYASGIGQGNVTGKILGRDLDVKVYWPRYSVGIYRGTIQSDGHLSGQTWDEKSSSNKAGWHSLSEIPCR